MAGRIDGERFIIAATLDPVETGQEFERFSSHMTLAYWFQMQESRRNQFLLPAMNRLFDNQPVYQELVGGKQRRFGEHGEHRVRTILGAETAPSFALRALVNSLGAFADGQRFAQTFNPHVTDAPERKVRKGEKIAIPTVALISAHSEEPLQRVVASFVLGKKDNG